MRYLGNYIVDNGTIAKKLAQKIMNGIESMCSNYRNLYDENELRIILDIKNMLAKSSEIDTINFAEEKLKPYIFRTWEQEINNGNYFVSWLKDGVFSKKNIISSTFGNNYMETFCNSNIGIKYIVNFNSFIGACEKDAATIIEPSEKKSIYTILELPNGSVVNSYNLATPIITPHQLFNYTSNTYLSKHNEIILDGRFAIADEIICLDKSSFDLAKRIGESFNIPFYEKYQR